MRPIFIPPQLFATAVLPDNRRVRPLTRIERDGRVYYKCLMPDGQLQEINEKKLKFEQSFRSKMIEVSSEETEALRVVLSEGARVNNTVPGRADIRKTLRREVRKIRAQGQSGSVLGSPVPKTR